MCAFCNGDRPAMVLMYNAQPVRSNIGTIVAAVAYPMAAEHFAVMMIATASPRDAAARRGVWLNFKKIAVTTKSSSAVSPPIVVRLSTPVAASMDCVEPHMMRTGANRSHRVKRLDPKPEIGLG